MLETEALANVFGRLGLKVAVEAEIRRQWDVAARVWCGQNRLSHIAPRLAAERRARRGARWVRGRTIHVHGALSGWRPLTCSKPDLHELIFILRELDTGMAALGQDEIAIGSRHSRR